MASVAEHLPGTRRVVVLCDASPWVPDLPGMELLGIDGWASSTWTAWSCSTPSSS
jgi:hypothetical protein